MAPGIDDLEWHKRRARDLMLIFQECMDQYGYGAEMLKVINPVAAAAARRYNAEMGFIRKLDPEFPPGWEPL